MSELSDNIFFYFFYFFVLDNIVKNIFLTCYQGTKICELIFFFENLRGELTKIFQNLMRIVKL